MNKSQNHNDLDLAFREHGAFLRRIALALTSDPWEADDATQDAFLAAAQSQSEGQESMRAWLATVLRRTIQKRRRSQSRRQLREIATAKTEGHILESRESLFRNLAELVTMLPRDVQSLLIRRYWESLSAREIAEQDGLSKSTVESRIRRAMETLRRHMDERSGGNRATWALALLASTTKSSGLGWKEGLILMSLKKITGAVVVAILLVLVFFSSGFFESDDPVALESSSKRAENEVSPEIRRSELLVASPVTEPRLAKTTVAEANGPRAIPNFPQGDLAVRLRTSKGELASNRLILATAIDREVGLVEVAAHTDAAGMAYFRGLPAGRHELVCPRAGQRTATIVVGQETKVDWTLCAAKELEGRVIDATGAPIAGAHIHLSLAVDPNHFAAVATTDEAGGFHLDGVESDYLVVTAAGFIPSPIMEILDQDRRPLVATLEKGGRSLEVAIVNENNEALADAWCRIVDFSVSELVKPGATGMSPDGERHEHLQTNFGHSLRSDAKGKLKIGGLGLGSLRIEARALGFEGRSLSISASDVAEYKTIVLWPEHCLRGRVIDEKGEALAQVRVSSGNYRGLSRYRAITNEDGQFEVRNLGSGQRGFEVDAGDRGQMKRKVEIDSKPVTGVTWTWDPGLSLRAQVLDDGNAPVAGLRVRARPLDHGNSVTWRDAKTDANGRFRLTSVEAVAQLIEFYDPQQMEQPILVVKGLKPQSEEHHIVLGKRSRAASFPFGRIINDKADGLPDAEIIVFGEDTMAASSRSVDSDGSFHYGPFGAGLYTVMISAEGYPEITKTISIERHQDFNLGDVLLPRPGRAIARLLLAANIERGQPSASVVSANARSFECRIEGDRCISPPLEPGRYTFRIWTARDVEASQVVEVKSGQDTEFDLRLEVGAACRISFKASDPSAMPKKFRVYVTREDGTEILDRQHLVKAGFDFQILQVLPVGRYRFVIENDLGLHREQTLTLPAVGQPEVPITLDITGR